MTEQTPSPWHQPPASWPQPQPQPAPPPPRRRRWPWVVGIAAALALIAGTIVVVLVVMGDTQLRQAYDECGGSADGVRLGDNDHTLVIEGLLGDAEGSADIKEVGCINQHLKMPESVAAQMASTRAIDGVQTAVWDHFTARWTYHPDDGLNLILTEE